MYVNKFSVAVTEYHVYLFSVCVCVHAHMPCYLCKGQRTTVEDGSCLPLCIPGTKLRLPGFLTSTFTCWGIQWPNSLLFLSLRVVGGGKKIIGPGSEAFEFYYSFNSVTICFPGKWHRPSLDRSSVDCQTTWVVKNFFQFETCHFWLSPLRTMPI